VLIAALVEQARKVGRLEVELQHLSAEKADIKLAFDELFHEMEGIEL
jgi:hypothetical protein